MMGNTTENLLKQITNICHRAYEDDLLRRIADLCCQASEEILEDERTREILNACGNLQNIIDEYLGI